MRQTLSGAPRTWLERAARRAGLEPAGARGAPTGGTSHEGWRVEVGAEVWALRGPRRDPSGDGATEALLLRWAAAEGLGPEVLSYDPEDGILLTRWIPGHPLDASTLAHPPTLAAAASILRRLHEAPLALPRTVHPLSLADAYLGRVSHPPPALTSLRARAARCQAALDAETSPPRPCHHDPTPANWLRADTGGLFLLDWEHGGLGEPAWDLAAILDVLPGARGPLLDAYCGVDALPTLPRRLALVGPLYRLVCAAWALVYEPPGAAEALARWLAPSDED